MRKLILSFLQFFALFVLLVNSNASAVEYRVVHDEDKFHVTADFGIFRNVNQVKLEIPQKWGVDYSSQIQNISVVNGKYDTKESTVKFNNKVKERRLVVKYDVVNVDSGLFAREFGNIYYNYIDKSKFLILGLGFFIRPEFLEASNCVANIKIDTRVNTLYNQYPYFTKFISVNIVDLWKIFILGNKDLYHKDIKNTKFVVWSDDLNLANRIEKLTTKIFENQDKFWQDDVFRVALFIPNPFSISKNKNGGTFIDNTLVNFLNPTTNEDIDIQKLISHENLHCWFGYNGLISGPKWFTEGFTEYFSYIINMKTNIISENEFNTKYNEVLVRYKQSKHKNKTNEEICNLFWNDKDAQKLPYLKGFLIAHKLDTEIKKRSKNKYNLRDIFIAVIKDAKKSKITMSEKLLFAYINKVAKINLRKSMLKDL